MKAVILAAGRGTRLRPLTDTVPKPMVSFRGVPLLEYTLSILPESVDSVVIVVGWLGHKIRNYFGRSFAGRPIEYVLQMEPRGTFHALHLTKGIVAGGDFLIVSGDDVYCAKDIDRVVRSENLSLLANKTVSPERFGICKVGENNLLETIIEKPKNFCGNLANIGVYKLNGDIFDEPASIGQTGEEILAPMIGTLAVRKKIEVIRASFWHPIADMNDWRAAQNILI